MIYRMKLSVPSYLCDVDDLLHTWAFVRLCQEVTEYHGNCTGIGFKTLLAQNHAWIITRALYHIHRLPEAFEDVEFSTWSRGHNGVLAWRDYRVTDAEGEPLLTGTSYWPMIDMTTRRPLRLGDVIAGYESHPDRATDHDQIDKLSIPHDAVADCSLEREVAYAMLDHTQHVNNSEYIRLAFDLLHLVGFDMHCSFLLELNYNHESRIGDTLSAHHYKVDGVHYVEIKSGDRQCVVARITPDGRP